MFISLDVSRTQSSRVATFSFDAHCERPVFHPTLPSCTAQRCCLSQHEETTVCVPRSTVKGCHVSQREVSNLCPIQHFLRAPCLDVWVSQHQVSTVCVPSNTSNVHCVWMSKWVIKWAHPIPSNTSYVHCTRMSCKTMRSERSVSHPTLPTCTVQGCLSESMWSEHRLCTHEHCTRMWGKSMRTCGISALQKRCQVFALAQPTPAAVSPIAGSVAATPSSLQSFSSPF